MRVFTLAVCLVAISACQRGVPQPGGRLDVDWTRLQRRCEVPGATQQAVAWTAYLLANDGPTWRVEMRSVPSAGEHGAPELRIGPLTAQQSPTRPFTQWLVPDAVEFTRDRVRFGDSTLTRSADGAHFDLHVIAEAKNGRRLALDAKLVRRQAPWLPGPTTLPSATKAGTCIDVGLLVPRADVSGSITVDGKTQSLRGTAYLDRIAWLTTEERSLLAWYRGVAHTDIRAAVFFKPLQRAARSQVYLGDSNGCQLCAADAPLTLPLPGPAAALLDMSYVRLGRVLRLRASVPAFTEETAGGATLTHAMLDLSDPQGRKRHEGPMVVDFGAWRTR